MAKKTINFEGSEKMDPLLYSSIKFFLESPEFKKHEHNLIKLQIIPKDVTSNKMNEYKEDLKKENLKIRNVSEDSLSVEAPIDCVPSLCKKQWTKRIEIIEELEAFSNPEDLF